MRRPLFQPTTSLLPDVTLEFLSHEITQDVDHFAQFLYFTATPDATDDTIVPGVVKDMYREISRHFLYYMKVCRRAPHIQDGTYYWRHEMVGVEILGRYLQYAYAAAGCIPEITDESIDFKYVRMIEALMDDYGMVIKKRDDYYDVPSELAKINSSIFMAFGRVPRDVPSQIFGGNMDDIPTLQEDYSPNLKYGVPAIDGDPSTDPDKETGSDSDGPITSGGSLGPFIVY